jgi:hypothetical protein
MQYTFILQTKKEKEKKKRVDIWNANQLKEEADRIFIGRLFLKKETARAAQVPLFSLHTSRTCV